MPKATTSFGGLANTGCTLNTGNITIPLKILPDISDTKTAHYNDETVIGRSFPIKTYAYSENRSIGMTVYFYADTPDALTCNLNYCRAIQAATYPKSGLTALNLAYSPPPLCSLKCSSLLSANALCVVLKRYTLKIPRDVPWDPVYLIPYYFTMDLEFDVVYNTTDLPGNERILTDIPAGANFSGTCV